MGGLEIQGKELGQFYLFYQLGAQVVSCYDLLAFELSCTNKAQSCWEHPRRPISLKPSTRSVHFSKFAYDTHWSKYSSLNSSIGIAWGFVTPSQTPPQIYSI